jgi:hypothetical protein
VKETPRKQANGELVPFVGDASVRLEGVDLAWTVPVVALSQDAVLVRVPESSEGGSLVHVELTAGAELVQGMGEVASVRPAESAAGGHELLIRFLFLDEPSRGVLRSLVERARSGHAGAASSAPEAAASASDDALVREALVDDPGPAAPDAALAHEPEPAAEPAIPRAAEAEPEQAAATAREGSRPLAPAVEEAGGWVLDPVDPDAVAGIDLSRLEPASGPPPAAEAAPAPIPGAARPAASDAPRVAFAASGSRRRPEAAAAAGDDIEEEVERGGEGRGWVLPAALIAVLFLAAAWWTRDAWLGGPGGPDPPEPAAGDVAGDAAEGAVAAGDAWRPIEAPPETPPETLAGAAADSGDAGDSGDETPLAAAEPAASSAGAIGGDDAQPSGPGEIVSIEVQDRGAETVVTIALSRPLAAADLSSFRLTDPPRFLVKLGGFATERRVAGGTAQLSRIRSGIHTGPGGRLETHLVFDLGDEGVRGSVAAFGARVEVRLASEAQR